MLEIIKYPNQILRQRTKKVVDILAPEIQELISAMIATMKNAEGVGLAAPQVNKNLRILAVNLNNAPQVFVNPKIIWKSFFKKKVFEEGCLSFPGIFGLVKRYQWIKLKYFNPKGQLCKIKAAGLLATVLQHEINHLSGILFIDKVLKYTKGEDKVKELIKQANYKER